MAILDYENALPEIEEDMRGADDMQGGNGGPVMVDGQTYPAGSPVTKSPEEAYQEIPPENKAQLEAYEDNATKIIFSEKSQPAILQELQTSNPIESTAQTALHVHRLLAADLERQGEKLAESTILLGSIHVISELNLLADAAKLFELNNQERLQVLQRAVMQYVKEGVETGEVDPVELQAALEPLLSEEQRRFGEQAMATSGVSKTKPPTNVNQTPGMRQSAPQPAQQPMIEQQRPTKGQGR